MELTNSQNIAYNGLKDRTSGAFLINGSAGTGKTFLVNKLVNEYRWGGNKILCIAPTHQAKYQMMAAMPDHKDIKFQTVASFLGTKAQIDIITGKKVFIEGNRAVMKENFLEKIIIVDESSMLTKSQVKKISGLAGDRLVIFLGDFCQLPPVKEEHSEDLFSRMITYTLVEQMRNAGDILTLCDQLRTNIIYPKKSTDDIIVCGSKNLMLVNMLGCIEEDSSPFKTCYLAYTNKAVNHIRNFIQMCLYGNDDYNVGQYVRIEEPAGTELTNGEMCQITKINKTSDIVFDVELDVFELEVVSCTTNEVHNIKSFRYSDQDIIQDMLRQFYDEASTAFKKFQSSKKEIDKRFWEDILQHIKKTYEFTLVGSPYSLTVHKSQGRSIDNVFLDTVDISKYGRDNTRALLYVGCSRTRNHLETIAV